MMSKVLFFAAALVFAACKTDAPTTLEDLPTTGSSAPSDQSLNPGETDQTTDVGNRPSEMVTPTPVSGPAIDAVTGYIDPVCRMKIAETSPVRATFEEVTFGFCSASCKTRFEADPERYLAALEE